MTRISWVEDHEATGDLAATYAAVRGMDPFGLGHVPAVFRAMSLRPDFLDGALRLAGVHFGDGALSRAQKEMIAAHVSVLNRCHF